MIMNIEEEIRKKTAETEEVLEAFLPKEEGLQKDIFSAMNYSLRAGGKRLRPMLMMETHRLFGGKSKALPYFMAAIEMIHTYSLVHDDLPAMDGDEYRRGKKSTWFEYGEALGILAGDALLNYAFETAAAAFEAEPENPRIGKALQVLARKAGSYGMIGGQVVDVEMEGKQMPLETLHFIHRLKTCALIEASMMIGAILAGAGEEEIRLTEESAYELGMAFQIQDDILDVVGSQEILGKPIGSDEKNGKQTYVTLLGLEASRQEAEEHSKKAVALLQKSGFENEFLMQLMLYLMNREK